MRRLPTSPSCVRKRAQSRAASQNAPPLVSTQYLRPCQARRRVRLPLVHPHRPLAPHTSERERGPNVPARGGRHRPYETLRSSVDSTSRMQLASWLRSRAYTSPVWTATRSMSGERDDSSQRARSTRSISRSPARRRVLLSCPSGSGQRRPTCAERARRVGDDMWRSGKELWRSLTTIYRSSDWTTSLSKIPTPKKGGP